MRRKTIPIHFFFAFVFSFVFVAKTKAQASDYPTQAEIDAKLAQIAAQNNQSGLGTFSPTNKGVMATGPEQNCASAIDVCAQTYTQATSYTGHGTIQEVKPGTCLGTQETNSVWYIFTVQTSGTFGFTLATTKDYDFALYDITTIGCAGVPTASPVRCNFSATYGNTGMSSAGTNPSEPASGSKWSTELAVTAGQTYALIVDNFSADATGYTLTFTGTSSIFDNTVPTMASITNNCNKTLTLTLSEQIRCNSIHADDFTITGPSAMTITSVSGVGCTGSNITNQVTITTSGAATSGTYTLHIQNGATDLNTLLDKCGNAMSTAQTITFNFLTPIELSASPSLICTSGAASTLTATGAPVSTAGIYSCSPGGLTSASDASGNGTFAVTPTATTTYNLSVTYGGCTQTASAVVTFVNNLAVTIDPVNPNICAGTTLLTASATIGGVACPTCTYQWSGGSAATTAAITVGAGTYNVVASSSGCSSNSASSTVTVSVPGVITGCSIYYVSPSGGGTGLTKASPTDLLTAIGLTTCTNAIIKMQVGTYNFSDKIDIGSFLTIEGGYNVGFTSKTSDMSSGGSTRIIRSSSPDGGAGTTVTTFNIAAAATGFRLQDLRMEMPIEAAGSQLTNYGIKLGAGCTSYNIVRCYIDAGHGAD